MCFYNPHTHPLLCNLQSNSSKVWSTLQSSFSAWWRQQQRLVVWHVQAKPSHLIICSIYRSSLALIASLVFPHSSDRLIVFLPPFDVITRRNATSSCSVTRANFHSDNPPSPHHALLMNFEHLITFSLINLYTSQTSKHYSCLVLAHVPFGGLCEI